MKLCSASDGRNGVVECCDEAQKKNTQWHDTQRHSLLV